MLVLKFSKGYMLYLRSRLDAPSKTRDTHDTHNPRCTSLHRCNSLDTSLQSSPTHRVAASHVRSALRNTSTRKHTRPGYPPTDHRSYTRTHTHREKGKARRPRLRLLGRERHQLLPARHLLEVVQERITPPSPPSSRASQPGRPYPPPCSPPPPAFRKGRLER